MDNRQWILVKRPVGKVDDDTLALRTATVPELQEGECLVRNLLLSLDPTNRVWMSDMDQYLPPVELGAVMRGGTIGRVVASRNPRIAVGDAVQGFGGWQDYWVAPAGGASKLRDDGKTPLTHYMGLLGMVGCTAYFGMLEIGNPQPGETVVVSAAAGAVGSIAVQLAKLRGARVIGIAGSDEKCAWLVNELGIDAAINYRSEKVRARIRELAPDGVNVYFDNTGGPILEAVLANLALHARIPLCGMIAGYNSTERPAGPVNYGNILTKRAMVKGFIILDYQARFGEAIAALAKWHAEGRLHFRVDVVDGLENTPRALGKLFDGSNQGKLIVRIANEPAA